MAYSERSLLFHFQEILVQLYTPQYDASALNGNQYPVAILKIGHESVGGIIETSVEWMECTQCVYNWTGKVAPNAPISWYKPSSESIEPWCLEVIEPSGLLMADNATSYGTGIEVDEAFQYIIRFWSKRSHETLRIHFDDLTGSVSSAIYLSKARIYTTQCAMMESCGLCGYYTGDHRDDFRYRVDYDNAVDEDDFGQISTEGVYDAHSLDPWLRSQNMTQHWKNRDILYRELRPQVW